MMNTEIYNLSVNNFQVGVTIISNGSIPIPEYFKYLRFSVINSNYNETFFKLKGNEAVHNCD